MPADGKTVIDTGARAGRNFAPERADAKVNVFESVVAHIGGLQAARKKVVVALWSEGSRDRMTSMLRDHKLAHTTSVNSWRTVQATPRNETMLAVLGLESGFETDEIALISEQDILDWCREHMAVYKAPRIVQFADALPKSGSGKVMWRTLQEAEARA